MTEPPVETVTFTCDRIEITVPKALAEQMTPELQAELVAFHKEQVERMVLAAMYGFPAEPVGWPLSRVRDSWS